MNTLKYNSGGGYMWRLKRTNNLIFIAIPDTQKVDVIDVNNISVNLEQFADSYNPDAVGEFTEMDLHTAKATQRCVQRDDPEWFYYVIKRNRGMAIIAVHDEDNEFLGYL